MQRQATRSGRAARAITLGLATAALAIGGQQLPVGSGVPASAAPKPATPRYEGYRCPDPVGHRVTQCRLGVHGTPDMSRRAWRRVFGAEVTVSAPFKELAANSEAAGARDWPLVDSLGQPMGRLRQDANGRHTRIAAVDGVDYKVVAMNVRGHGCAASDEQMRTATLVQLIAPQAPSHGTQAFLSIAAVADPAAQAVFTNQLGGGTGCGPAGSARTPVRPLADPRVGATAHARLSSGVLNTVTEYDAKAPFGNTVYFMTNTTSVRVGGVTRGMVRVGTPVAKVDGFRRCDPNSDGTLTWRYLAIATGVAAKPWLYGWIPARCPARMRR